MDLRYRLAVVTGAGAGLGREVAVALSRVGASVLAADHDLGAAEETAALVRRARVTAWALQVELTEELDLRLLAARAVDLGGADLLVDVDPGPSRRLTELFLQGLPERRGRRDGSPAVVNVGPGGTAGPGVQLARFTEGLTDPTVTAGARVMAVLPGRAPSAEVTRAVVDLLAHGAAGRVVEPSGV